MTAVDLDALDKLRGALVSFGIDYAQEASDALLPVVDRIANERAAAELRAAADDLANPRKGAAYEVWAHGGGDWLRRRADALDPT